MKKLINKLAVIVLVFSVLVAWAPKSYAAERNLYTVKTASGETYKIIADVDGDNVQIVGSPFCLVTEANTGNIATGSSYYNLIAGDYETGYNNRNTDTIYSQSQIDERMKNRSKDLIRLLQFYINAQETNDADTSTIIIKFGDEILIEGRGATYAYGKVSGKTYDKIITSVQSNVKTNPYAIIPDVNNPIYNSEKITVGDNKLKDIYTNEKLILLYEKALTKPEWITKEATTESQITTDGYLLQVDKSLMDYTGEIYIKVVDSTSTTEYATFLLAEKQSIGNKYKETVYSNEESRTVKWFENNGVKGITTTASKGINPALSLYYQIINGQRRTLDYYASGTQLDIEDKAAFVAIRNSDSRSVFVYRIKTSNNVQTVTLLGTVNIDSIGEDLSTGSISVTSNNWVIDKTGTKIRIYKVGETDPDNNCYYLNFDGMYKCYTKGSNMYDIAIPATKGINGTFDTGFNKTPGSYVAFVSTTKTVTKREATDPMAAFENDYLDNKVPMTIEVCQVPEGIENDGTSFDKKVDVSKLTTSAKSSELPPKLQVKEAIKEDDAKQVVSAKTTASAGGSRITGTRVKGSNGDSSAVTKEDSVTFGQAFLTDTVSVGKNILIILIFCAIVAAGFRHALKGATDPKEREQTKITLKNILVGILIFICLSLIVTLIWDFTYKGLDLINGQISAQAEQEFENEDQITRGSLLLDIIEVILKVVNEIEAGIIEILSKQLVGDANLSVTSTAIHEASSASATTKQRGINYISLIYNVYTPDGAISSMMPFDAAGVEWSRLLAGYNMLVSVAFVVMILAIAITAVQFVMFAGNVKKITAVKGRLVRMFWAVLLLITVPYLVQFLLFIFNYLTAAVPVNWDDPRFIVDIRFEGVLGEIARNLFLTTQCQIYMAFLVRHVMLAILLVSGPVVIVTWAIYERFRSFPVWFGELFTNIAMQFCYAVGFMIVIFLSYEGQNAVYGLILVSTAMGLSKFVKESLQGYFQEWGGIDEEGTASSIVKMAFGWANKAKRTVKKVGGALEKASNKMDESQTDEKAVVVGNVGKVLQGKFGKVTTSKDRAKNMEKAAAAKSKQKLDDEGKTDKSEGKTVEDEQYDAKKEYDDFMNDPNISDEEKAEVEDYFNQLEDGNFKEYKTGRGYDLARSLSRANRDVSNERARKQAKAISDYYSGKDNGVNDKTQNLDYFKNQIKNKALQDQLSGEDKRLLEIGEEAFNVKKEVAPEEVVEKLNNQTTATMQAITQLAAIEDVAERDKAIRKCESSIQALAVIDAKANDARMQEELVDLVNKVAEYKAEKLMNGGIKIDPKSVKALEQAMLLKIYETNGDKEKD